MKINRKKIEFIKNLLLDSLLEDDEPLDNIFLCGIVDESFNKRLRSPYNNYLINKSEIKIAIDELLDEQMVEIHDENQNRISSINIGELLNQYKDEYSIYFVITEKGKKLLHDNEKKYWID